MNRNGVQAIFFSLPMIVLGGKKLCSQWGRHRDNIPPFAHLEMSTVREADCSEVSFWSPSSLSFRPVVSLMRGTQPKRSPALIRAQSYSGGGSANIFMQAATQEMKVSPLLQDWKVWAATRITSSWNHRYELIKVLYIWSKNCHTRPLIIIQLLRCGQAWTDTSVCKRKEILEKCGSIHCSSICNMIG